MFFGFVLLRILFVASMVFIIGYVFGNFSARPALRTITRIATILVIVLFRASNAFFFRSRAWHGQHHDGRGNCGWYQQDSARVGR